MDVANSIGVLLGGSWASGVNLYMTVAGLGIAQRMHWIALPGDMKVLAHPLIIAVAALLYAVEFVADKIPFVDSAWDAVHTFIRPVGGAALGYMAAAGVGPALQIPVALASGAISASSHLTKATTRVAINTAPAPLTNSVASVTEDVSVAGMLVLIMKHPIIAGLIVVAFVIFAVWFLRKMYRFVKRLFRPAQRPQVQPHDAVSS